MFKNSIFEKIQTRGFSYFVLYWEAPPQRVTFFRLSIQCIRKGSNFNGLSILKGREICHLGLLKGPIGLIDE